ncbi:MAG: hypothetical protein EPN14_01240 [Gallionella sp.]|nr:MAG: hypothetical protein EPN14_01240 [Gallionella sp.]
MVKEKTQRGGARGKLRAHFLANIGRVMDSEELRAVWDNQSEWARRVRELIHIRRATSQDQLEVLQWLIKKFPKQTAEKIKL